MNKILLPATLVIIIIVGLFGAGKVLNREHPTVIPQTSLTEQDIKIFQSSILNFVINLPNSYTVTEKGTRVMISSTYGDIVINRTGTNFGNLSEFLDSLNEAHETQILEDIRLTLNGYDTSLRKIKYNSAPDKVEKQYKLFVDGVVYSLSTSSESLYNDLDRIARSFRYTP